MPAMDVHEVQPHVLALRHDLGPRGAARTFDGRRHEPEVLRAVVREDEEAILLVFDRILDVPATRLDHDGLGGR